jgi:hypothetical protein
LTDASVVHCRIAVQGCSSTGQGRPLGEACAVVVLKSAAQGFTMDDTGIALLLEAV